METKRKVKLREIINEIAMEQQHMPLSKRRWYEGRIMNLFTASKRT